MYHKLRLKILPLFLSVFLLLPALVGCKDRQNPPDSDSGTQNPTEQATESLTTEKDQKPEDVLAASPHLVGATDQKNSRLVVLDLNKGDLDDPEAIVWEYKNKRARQAAGIKFRHNDLFGGDVVLFCGPEGAGIVNYETKELMYFTSTVGSNPHTVELLPDGTFLVGSTDGKQLHFFDAAGGGKRATYVLDWKWDVHGVLWDPEYDVLWVSGGSELQAYRLSGTPTAPDPKPVPGMNLTFEMGSLHDLAPVYGNTGKLWVTAVDGVLQIDKKTMTPSKSSYRGSETFNGRTYTPGIGNYPDGTIVYVFPDGSLNSWNTSTIRLCVPYGEIKHKNYAWKSTGDAYYKVRVFCTDYQ